MTPGAEAYPEFIAQSYRSCLTCHYNGTGGGALTDYGRALFATEFAGKPPWLGEIDDEKLAAYSNFLGPVGSPYWLKPGVKYRRLANTRNPGSASSDTQYYTMQVDLNLAAFASEDATFGVISTLSYVESPRQAFPNRPLGGSELMAREYYVRWQQKESTWWYIGLADKAYGIKHPDHTAVNRAPLNVGANDQVHGVIYHWQSENHELFVHPFVGNLHRPESERLAGASVLYERALQEKFTAGGSLKFESGDPQQLLTTGGVLRKGLIGGHTLMAEVGLKHNRLEEDEATLGYYGYLESQLRLLRGFNFQSIFQFERNGFGSEYPRNYRWGFGLLYFPLQRVELRAQAVQSRTRSTERVSESVWDLQTQIHLSL